LQHRLPYPHVQRVQQSVDALVEAGYLLAPDGARLVEEAQGAPIPRAL
jgi:hypothetical protein